MAQVKETAADLINEAAAIVSFLNEAMDALLNYTLQNSDCFYDQTSFGICLTFHAVGDRLEKALKLMEEGGE